MAYSNGRYPRSALRRIYHPSYTVYLARDPEAAAAWNTMALAIYKATKARIYPLGPNSAYRDYATQVRFKALYGGNAASPGYSNHGLGQAVDLATRGIRSLIDRFGRTFGWAKAWSDASWEWWHLKYRPGVWKRRPNPGPSVKYPNLRRGSGGPGQQPYVNEVRKHLRRKGHKVKKRGPFNKDVERALKNFQRNRKIKATGRTNPRTWQALRKPKRKR